MRSCSTHFTMSTRKPSTQCTTLHSCTEHRFDYCANGYFISPKNSLSFPQTKNSSGISLVSLAYFTAWLLFMCKNRNAKFFPRIILQGLYKKPKSQKTEGPTPQGPNPINWRPQPQKTQLKTPNLKAPIPKPP